MAEGAVLLEVVEATTGRVATTQTPATKLMHQQVAEVMVLAEAGEEEATGVAVDVETLFLMVARGASMSGTTPAVEGEKYSKQQL